jgi:hypothetical protein
VARGKGPEFKPQYHKKKKKERKVLADTLVHPGPFPPLGIELFFF